MGVVLREPPCRAGRVTSPQFPRRAHTVRGGTVTPAQFWALTQIARTSEPSREAARLVLVEGRSVAQAVEATGVLQPSVSRLVIRLRRAHDLLSDAYSPPERRSPVRI